MPGDEWQKFANLRLLFGYMFAQPGKKLLFMGGEFGQVREWAHDSSLDWNLVATPVLPAGYNCWVEQSELGVSGNIPLYTSSIPTRLVSSGSTATIARPAHFLLRKGKSSQGGIVVVCNFTPVPRLGYHLGVPAGGFWRELLNSDATEYGGSGMGNLGGVQAAERPVHGRPCSLELTLPPLGVLFLKAE